MAKVMVRAGRNEQKKWKSSDRRKKLRARGVRFIPDDASARAHGMKYTPDDVYEARVVTSVGLSERINALQLEKKDAAALIRGLRRLGTGDIEAIVTSPVVHSATVQGNTVYSLKASNTLRVMFGVDEAKKKVLVYDVLKKQ